MSVFKTTTRSIRTGHVIAVPADGYRRTLEVEIVHHSTQVLADGTALPVVRFTGWADGERVERGWGQELGARVLVVEDRRGGGSFQDLA